MEYFTHTWWDQSSESFNTQICLVNMLVSKCFLCCLSRWPNFHLPISGLFNSCQASGVLTTVKMGLIWRTSPRSVNAFFHVKRNTINTFENQFYRGFAVRRTHSFQQLWPLLCCGQRVWGLGYEARSKHARHHAYGNGTQYENKTCSW